jgi:hypothetical protein
VRRKDRVAAVAAATAAADVVVAWFAFLVSQLFFATPLGAPIGKPDLIEKETYTL